MMAQKFVVAMVGLVLSPSGRFRQARRSRRE